LLKAHHVEHAADDLGIIAQVIGAGDRHVDISQRRQHAEFAVDRMRAFQQFTWRLPAQHIVPTRRLQQKSGIRLAAGEFFGA